MTWLNLFWGFFDQIRLKSVCSATVTRIKSAGPVVQVINKGYFSKAFLFKPRGGRSPPSGLNSMPRKYPIFCL